MRVETHSFVILAGFGVAIAGFWGCSGDITTATGGTTGGGGGAHPTTGTTGPTSSSVTTVASTVASSSSGGGNACMQECAMAQTCTGFDVCGAGNIDCANPTAQAMCVTDCLAQAMPTCANFLTAGQACFQMCMPPPPDGGPMDGGPMDGGNTPCDMACAHIQMCTGFSCSVVGINCATVGSQMDCEFTCANNTPCSMLGQGTLQTCQSQCADGGAMDGGP